MSDELPSLRPATAEEITTTLIFALRHRGRRVVHDAWPEGLLVAAGGAELLFAG